MGTGQHSLRQTVQSKKQLPVLEHREEKSLDVLWASSYRLLVMFIHKLSFFFGGHIWEIFTQPRRGKSMPNKQEKVCGCL